MFHDSVQTVHVIKDFNETPTKRASQIKSEALEWHSASGFAIATLVYLDLISN